MPTRPVCPRLTVDIGDVQIRLALLVHPGEGKQAALMETTEGLRTRGSSRPTARHRSPTVIALTVAMVSVALAGGAALSGGAIGPSPAPTRLARVRDDVPATAMDEAFSPVSNSPALVADPSDSRFIVLPNRLDGPDFSCALQVSGDSGASWIPANAVPRLPTGVDKCYAPEAAFDRSGRLYYLFVGLAGKGNHPVGAFLTRSDDRGRTFSVPRQVLGPLNFGVRLAIDSTLGANGRIHQSCNNLCVRGIHHPA